MPHCVSITLRMCRTFFLILAIALLVLPSVGRASEILVGMSTALSGFVGGMGGSVKEGIESAFKEQNASGGVRGRHLRLITLDDAYVAERAGQNTRKLLDKEGVIAMLGNLGTPTANVTVPIVNEKKTLLFGAYTGADVLRKNPPDPYIYNYRAGYTEEITGIVHGLVHAGIKPEEMAFFTQDGSYGDSGFESAMKALASIGFKGGRDLPHGRYKQGQRNVEDGLLALLDAPEEPKAILIIAVAGAGAKFVKKAKEDFPDTLFIGLSPMANQGFISGAGEAAEGVIFTQVVPHHSTDLPTVQQYRKSYTAHTNSETYNADSLEGYLVGKIFIKALLSISGDLTRQSVTDAMAAMGDFDLGIGVPLNLSADNHQANHTVWPSVVKEGKFQHITWKTVAERLNP